MADNAVEQTEAHRLMRGHAENASAFIRRHEAIGYREAGVARSQLAFPAR